MKGVDTPVEDTFGVSDTDPNLYVAHLEMAVYPGVRTVIDTTNNPWEFGVWHTRIGGPLPAWL